MSRFRSIDGSQIIQDRLLEIKLAAEKQALRKQQEPRKPPLLNNCSSTSIESSSVPGMQHHSSDDDGGFSPTESTLVTPMAADESFKGGILVRTASDSYLDDSSILDAARTDEKDFTLELSLSPDNHELSSFLAEDFSQSAQPHYSPNPFLFERVKSVHNTKTLDASIVTAAGRELPGSLSATPQTIFSPTLGEGAAAKPSLTLDTVRMPPPPPPNGLARDMIRLGHGHGRTAAEVLAAELKTLKVAREPAPKSPVISFDASPIPTPIMNAISFTPPIGGAIVVASEEDGGVSDVDSIFTSDLEDCQQQQQQPQPQPQQQIPNTPPPVAKSTDRGKLLVKLGSLDKVQLPIVADRNPKFFVTIDDGAQSISTKPAPLSADSAIDLGQEFELVVGKDLKLNLTFHASMDKAVEKKQSPRPSIEPPRALTPGFTRPATPPLSPKKQSRLKSIFSSPKKRSHVDLSDTLPQRKVTPPPQTQLQREPDVWDGKVGGVKGEFGTCQIAFSDYEDQVYGKARTLCFDLANSWDTVDPGSKTGSVQVTLMFIPLPSDSGSDNLPTTIDSAVGELDAARAQRDLSFEGYLSQEGGDCNYWRRRWFKLHSGTTLIGHTEDTKKVRTVLNLVNVERVELVDEMDHGHGLDTGRTFRVRFRDGEVVDFYADTSALRDRWMDTLHRAVSLCHSTKGWTDMVLNKTAI